MQNILINKGGRKKELVEFLEEYSFDTFCGELQTWFLTGTQTWFIHGNFSKDQALQIVTNSRELLSLQEIAVDQLAKVRPLKLKEGQAMLFEE